ncbi:MAG: hypothetical protein CSA11_07040 [Chloroflexi bacterium]|nr:MAG: hypothetical protein CSA11_07040 [Chloroflexota bacterium]
MRAAILNLETALAKKKAFRCVFNRWVKRSVSSASVAVIFLPIRVGLAILGEAFTLTCCAVVYNYLSYLAFMIPSV